MTDFPYAAMIEESLQRVAERCEDPTPLVYGRLFKAYPDMRAQFWRDADGAIKGEMLSRTFAAILDFVGERRYADVMIGSELITHEGYDIPREVFASFFGVVADAVREILGDAWTGETALAWRELLAEIDGYVQKTPRIGRPPPRKGPPQSSAVSASWIGCPPDRRLRPSGARHRENRGRRLEEDHGRTFDQWDQAGGVRRVPI